MLWARLAIGSISVYAMKRPGRDPVSGTAARLAALEQYPTDPVLRNKVKELLLLPPQDEAAGGSG